ncbi:MAG TPA: DnaD domain protein [Levilinea sp.]|nr:DnaD domain protein [Levilinea sp.]
MSPFAGFPAVEFHFIPLPAPFFRDLLPQIDDLAELKVTLYAFWYLDQQEGNLRYLIYSDFSRDKPFLAGLGSDDVSALRALGDGLHRAVARGTLLQGLRPGDPPDQALYLLNSPRGRAALAAYYKNEWSHGNTARVEATLDMDRPNVYRLYEENIGPLTPLIADAVRDAENTYPIEWIEEAVRLAVQKNARHWRYVEAILQSWQKEGRHASNRRRAQQDSQRYREGEYGDFGEV